MNEVKFEVRVETLSPLNIGSGTQKKSNTMATTIRSIGNKTMIPGSTIKGKLKYNFLQLKGEAHIESGDCECSVCRLFGKPGFSPSKVFVEDFKLVGEEVTEVRSSNRIDRHRKVCSDGALFTKEVVYGVYIGYVTAYVANEEIKKAIEAALCLIRNIGSGKSSGMGHVKTAVKEVEV